MILKIKPCCGHEKVLVLSLYPQLDTVGYERNYYCRVGIKDSGYMAIYCRMCGTKIEIEVEI